jgi:small subunit ribosomal protein S20
MANIKQSQKRARQEIVRKQINLARKTAIKTALKKVVSSVESTDTAATMDLLRDAQARLARAKNKGVLHKNTAARKISRLAKFVNAALKAKK